MAEIRIIKTRKGVPLIQSRALRKESFIGYKLYPNLYLNIASQYPRARVFWGKINQSFSQERKAMSRTLVLNATYEPLGVITERRALILVLNHRATMIEESGTVLHFSGGKVDLPSVIRLNKFVRIPYRHAVPLSRRAIFARDGGRCVYCAAPATSIDHVIPRSRGGGHNWENVVSACHKCNHLKADKQLKEIGWRLRQIPREPVGAAWRILGTGQTNSRWLQYLEPFGVAAATA
jgi:5-methylcytosine-specific restriction endonuclease McrA